MAFCTIVGVLPQSFQFAPEEIRVLGDASPFRFLFDPAKLPQPHRNRTAQGWRLGCDGAGRHESDCAATGAAVSNRQSRPGSECARFVRCDGRGYSSHPARASCGCGSAARDCLCECVELALGPLREPQARDCCARRAGCVAWTADSPVRDRRHGVDGGRQPAGHCRGSRGRCGC